MAARLTALCPIPNINALDADRVIACSPRMTAAGPLTPNKPPMHVIWITSAVGDTEVPGQKHPSLAAV